MIEYQWKPKHSVKNYYTGTLMLVKVCFLCVMFTGGCDLKLIKSNSLLQVLSLRLGKINILTCTFSCLTDTLCNSLASLFYDFMLALNQRYHFLRFIVRPFVLLL